MIFPSEQLTICSQKPPAHTFIPQRPYTQGAPIPDGILSQTITFMTVHGGHFPAELALTGQCNLLVDGDSEAFTDRSQTINLRTEVIGLCIIPKLSFIPFLHLQWPGYDGWGGQAGAMSPG